MKTKEQIQERIETLRKRIEILKSDELLYSELSSVIRNLEWVLK